MINRDAGFWNAIATHPAVAPAAFMGLPAVDLAPLVEPESSLPLASEHGGWIFSTLDPHGFVYELHTIYTPEGWGREVHSHAKLCFKRVFETASLVVTHEQEGYNNTRPPLSFGWRSSGDFKDVGLPRKPRMWVLTKEAWAASPVGKKLCH